MVINHLEKLFVTNDAGTMLHELEVQHPAAKMLVLAAHMQEEEFGDATNICVIFGGELMEQAENLIRMGLHPADVVAGYEKAHEKLQELLPTLYQRQVKDVHDENELSMLMMPVVGSHQPGMEYVIAPLVARACLNVMPKKVVSKFNLDNVRVCKVLGASVADSFVVNGMVIPHRKPDGVLVNMEKCRVAVFQNGVDLAATETKGTVLIQNASQLKEFSIGEENTLDTIIKSIADTGVNVIISGSAVGELALHYCQKYGILLLRIPSKFEMRRVCRLTGAIAQLKLEAPAPDAIGSCSAVSLLEVGSTPCTVFRQDDELARVSTIVLRGSAMNIMDDVERAVADAAATCKAVCLSDNLGLLPGGGAAEISLYSALSDYAATLPGLDQYAVAKYAESLMAIPRSLAENGGKDSSAVVSSLLAASTRGEKTMGVSSAPDTDLDDMVAGQIWDLGCTKAHALRLATDAAITVLRVDQIIMSKPAGGLKDKPVRPEDD